MEGVWQAVKEFLWVLLRSSAEIPEALPVVLMLVQARQVEQVVAPTPLLPGQSGAREHRRMSELRILRRIAHPVPVGNRNLNILSYANQQRRVPAQDVRTHRRISHFSLTGYYNFRNSFFALLSRILCRIVHRTSSGVVVHVHIGYRTWSLFQPPCSFLGFLSCRIYIAYDFQHQPWCSLGI